MSAPTTPRPLPNLPRLPRPVDPAPIRPSGPAYSVADYAETFRHTLQNLSDAELSVESRRTATLPPSGLATEMRHLVDAEVEYRIAQRRAASDALIGASRADRVALGLAAAEARRVCDLGPDLRAVAA